MNEEKLDIIMEKIVQTLGETELTNSLIKNILDFKEYKQEIYEITDNSLNGVYCKFQNNPIKINLKLDNNRIELYTMSKEKAYTTIYQKLNNEKYIIATCNRIYDTKNEKNELKTINNIKIEGYNNDKIIMSKNIKETNIKYKNNNELIDEINDLQKTEEFLLSTGDSVIIIDNDGSKKSIIKYKTNIDKKLKFEEVEEEYARSLINKDPLQILSDEFINNLKTRQ